MEVPANLQNSKNKNVLNYLAPLSCHSDIVGPLYKILKACNGSEFFCPDSNNFKYCLWFVNTNVFSYAAGMQNIALKLPLSVEASVVAEGALKCEDAGIGWYLFPYNHSSLNKWALLAFENAANS